VSGSQTHVMKVSQIVDSIPSGSGQIPYQKPISTQIPYQQPYLPYGSQQPKNPPFNQQVGSQM